MTIVEEKGNKILAYFMKVEWTEELNYHEDWNKLMQVWIKLPVTTVKGTIVGIDNIINTILKGDVRKSWGVIVGYINKNILTEEEYLKFK